MPGTGVSTVPGFLRLARRGDARGENEENEENEENAGDFLKEVPKPQEL